MQPASETSSTTPAPSLVPPPSAHVTGAQPPASNGLREQVGGAIGKLWAPAVAGIAKLRHARMFHPVGHTFGGRVSGLDSPFGDLGERLAGHVIARLSGALWKAPVERFDVLGIALRFRSAPVFEAIPADGDQDLLFATIRSPLTMLLSPLFTDASDFVTNRYWAVSPFALPSGDRVELRLSPETHTKQPGRRDDRLRAAVEAGEATWVLEARKTLTLTTHPVARIHLDHAIELDQDALHFDPFRTGRGVQPVGVIHAIRRAAYSASQAARP